LLGLALIYDLPTSAFKVAVISSRHTGFSSWSNSFLTTKFKFPPNFCC
jgi:hypothetical protein